LNNGGSMKTILGVLPSPYYPDSVRYEDLTGDGMPELMYAYYSGFGKFYIFTCSGGKYILFESKAESISIEFYRVLDMNLDSIPELVIITHSCTGGGCYKYYVLNWNGNSYVDLALGAYVDDVLDETIKDINNDGTLEIVVNSVPVPYFVSPPWRKETHTFIWDGKSFVAQQVEYAQPDYRFQAIQDGDLEASIGKYDKALNLYKQAIFHNSLEWWSPERQKYENDKLGWYVATPSVKPLEDKTEYSRLAAYAYYRIMLLHIMQGNETDAGTVFNTLQKKFGNDPYGHPYVEMATAFWNAYQSTHKMYDGCAAIIPYAVGHTEILTPLGSDYHGSQSHIYVPADVCPFRYNAH